MARKRMIDPEFWSDEEIAGWSFAARLFYIGLWNFADDEGRFKAHDDLLRAQIFPYEKKIDISALKKEMNGKIRWYEADGLKYGFVRNFLKHQSLDHPTKSKLPIPPKLAEDSSKVRRGLAEDSPLIEEKLREEKRRPAAQLTDEDFLKTLRTNPAYRHVNIDIELGKMDAYLAVHAGRQKTRRFIVAWLNRIDRPMATAAAPVSRKAKPNPKCDVCGGTGKLKDRAGAQCFCVV